MTVTYKESTLLYENQSSRLVSNTTNHYNFTTNHIPKHSIRGYRKQFIHVNNFPQAIKKKNSIPSENPRFHKCPSALLFQTENLLRNASPASSRRPHFRTTTPHHLLRDSNPVAVECGSNFEIRNGRKSALVSVFYTPNYD